MLEIILTTRERKKFGFRKLDNSSNISETYLEEATITDSILSAHSVNINANVLGKEEEENFGEVNSIKTKHDDEQ